MRERRSGGEWRGERTRKSKRLEGRWGGQEWGRTEMWAGQTDGWTGRYEKVSDIHRGIHVENNSIK